MSPFPSDLPADVTDPDNIRAHDWQAFSSLDHMNSHWVRPEWTPRTRAYYWMLPFNGCELVKLAEHCQARIESSAFDLVPLDALHITVGRIGFRRRVTPATVQRVADVAQRLCSDLATFRLDVGPLAGSRGALRFSVTPWSSLLAMHQRLAEATARVLGDQAVMDTRSFRPHLSIAYANTRVPLDPLRVVVEELRELPPVAVTVPDVSVVELWRDGRTYRFNVLRRVGFDSE